MVSRFWEFENGLSQRRDSSNETEHGAPANIVRLVLLALGLSLGLTLLMIAMTTLARMNPAPLLNLPESLRPGSPLPQQTVCHTPVDEGGPRCWLPLAVDMVYFDVDPATRQILRSVIPAQHYRMRDLYAAWGRPDGVRWRETQVQVYWQSRSALFYADSLHAESRVDFILFDPRAPDEVSAWNGFRPPQI